MSELRECPCCGRRGVRVLRVGIYLDWQIYCADCGANTGPYGTRENAITSWNRRSAAAGRWRPMSEFEDKPRARQIILLDKKGRVHPDLRMGTVMDFVAFAEIYVPQEKEKPCSK